MTSTDPRSFRTKAEFGAGLTALRKQADLSIRDLAKLIDIPSATLGGWCSGRNLPLPGQLSSLRKAVNACGVVGADADVWLEVADQVRGTAAPRSVPRPASPYPGLTSFDVTDAAVFFGREDDTTRILDRLAQLRDDPGPSHGILAVVGASGSGKTSLLRAGVAAYLATLQKCTYTVRTPGTDPLTMLANARDELGPGPAVLVIDQFEELFTATTDPDTRTRFLTELTELAPDTLVVIGMRADFYAAAAGEAPFVSVLQHGQVLLEPLGSAGLRDAVQRPAEAAGVKVENGLVDLVMSDLAPRDSAGQAHDAGALPLLSHALRAAWERGTGAVLTIDDYRAADGIDGAIARTAEDAFETVERQDDARSLFLRLVNIDNVAVTRRRVSGGELTALREAGFSPVIDEFVTRRLITVSADAIEISHEALLSAWPRLREWVDEDRIGLKLHRQVTEAANAWEQSGRDDTLLLRGARLDAASDLAERPTLRTDLTRFERTFVATAIDARDAAADRARRGTRRLRRLLAAVVVLFLVAAGLAAYAFRAQSNANASERDASTARDNALSRQVAVESRQLADSDPALAQQLALASFRIAPTAEARGAVIDTSARPIVSRFLGRFGFSPLAVTTDRKLAAVGQTSSGEVRLVSVSATASKIVSRLTAGPGNQSITGLTFAPDGRTLYVLSSAKRLDVWNIADRSRPRRTSALDLGSLTPRAVAASPDGRTLFVGGRGPQPLQRWDVSARPRLVAALPGVPADPGVEAIAVSPDGQYLAAASRSSLSYVWRASALTATPRTIEVGGNLTFSVLFGPGRLYLGDSDGRVTVVDPATGRRIGAVVGAESAWVLSLALSPDGKTLGAGGSDNSFRQYSTTTLRQVSIDRNPTQVTGVAYLADGSGIVLTCGNGATYVKPFRGNRIPTPATTFNLLFDRTGSRMVAATDSGGMQVWDIRGATPEPVTKLVQMTGTKSSATGTAAISADGNLTASGNFLGQVQLYDISKPDKVRPWGPPFPAAGALIESLNMSPTGDILAVGSDDKTVALWDVSKPANPRRLAVMPGGDIFYNVAWSPDGTMIAGADVDSHVYLWSVADPRRPVRLAKLGGFDQEVWGVAFSRDGNTLAGTGSDRTTRLWDITDPRRPRSRGLPLIGPTDYVYAASFNPDGSLLAVSSNDRTVRLYDLRSGQRTPLVTLTDVAGAVFAVNFSPDGRSLVASGNQDAAPVWTTDAETFAARMCARTGTPISTTEWAQYIPGVRYDPPCP